MNVHELRNSIRLSVGRFTRVEPTQFTKEDLAAICAVIGYDINQDNLPSKAEMRAGILWKLDLLDEPNPDEADRAFRKDELTTINNAVTAK